VIAVEQIPQVPPPQLRHRPSVQPLRVARDVWAARELVRSLAERDLRARYKQAFLGWGWALAQPLSLLLVFTFFSKRVGHIGTAGAPYPLYAMVGLLGWQFFSSSLTSSGLSLLNNTPLLNKVYCPRQAFPLAGICVAVVDAAIGAVALLALFVNYHRAPTLTALWLPVVLLLQVVFTIAVVLLLSSIMVYARDLRSALPLVLQFLLLATPVAYGMNVFGPRTRMLYSLLNPMGPIIDSYRRILLFAQQPDWALLGIASASSLLLAIVAWVVFARLESGMADVL
jgi:ABC-type polysaccharide/polyol phosphate export permease